MFRRIAQKYLPLRARSFCRRALSRVRDWRENRRLVRWRRELGAKDYGACISFDGYRVRITDGPNFYIQYKDGFVRRVYHFETDRTDPLIIDGGSNFGMSILYFKRIHPEARIIGFEPDPAIFSLLRENLAENRITGVELINAGLGAEAGQAAFQADGGAGGLIAPGAEGLRVRVERLSGYLSEPVDFLKLNIEGMELPVLREVEASGKLAQVRQLVIEYHGWAKGEQRLGQILDLLDRSGFRYLVHDFDAETCGASKPPFRWNPQANWFCLVYGCQPGARA